MSPKITIGISFKNPGRYFELALKSIFAQTFTDWELILIDDGSSDESLELAKSIKDQRVRVYADGESRGLNIRLNQMIQYANAPYFARMDADDIMHPQRLELQYQALLENDENTVIGSSAYSININSQVMGLRPSRSLQQYGFDARHSFLHPTVIASTTWFRRNGYSSDFIYQRAQDAELWCRTSKTTKFINLPQPLLFYRESGGFSLQNYTGTSLGLINIIHEQYEQAHKAVYLIMRELTKLGIASALANFGFSEQLIKRRYQTLDISQRQIATDTIQHIQGQELPVNPAIHAMS
jgi:glycosyltransferase involved in cell wall biosynthesis